jgi:hypothetical protein
MRRLLCKLGWHDWYWDPTDDAWFCWRPRCPTTAAGGMIDYPGRKR